MCISDINITAAIYCYALRKIKLTIASTRTTPFGNEITIRVKLLYSVILCISDINITAAIYCYVKRVIKVPGLRQFRPQCNKCICFGISQLSTLSSIASCLLENWSGHWYCRHPHLYLLCIIPCISFPTYNSNLTFDKIIFCSAWNPQKRPGITYPLI